MGLLVVSLERFLREHASRVRVPFPHCSDGPDLVLSRFVLPRPVQPRPSTRPHLLGILVAVELEALLGRHQVQVLKSFLAHGSLDLLLSSSAGRASLSCSSPKESTEKQIL